MLAIRGALGETVGADLLIEAALRALLEGVDSPSLVLLAGLGRSEESEAQDLFRATVSELDLAPSLPAERRALRWELVRWWCQLILAGQLRPEVGGRLIWMHGWDELDYPASLQQVVGLVSEWEDWSPDWSVDREDYGRGIVDEAAALLAGPWPPE